VSSDLLFNRSLLENPAQIEITFKFHLEQAMKAQRGVELELYPL
jgi:hypothetical protein